MKVAYQLSGFAELDALLKQLPKSVARKITTQALRKAGAIVRDEARSLVPVETGELRKAIKVAAGRKQRRNRTAVFVGVIGKEGRLAHLVEYGTVAHMIASKNKRVLADASTGVFFGRKVQHPGTPRRPFMRPALDTKAGEVFQRVAEEVGAGIDREVDLLLKAGGVRR